jgi:uncharacterized protein with HEPN domain
MRSKKIGPCSTDRATAVPLHDALFALDKLAEFTTGISREEFDQQRATQLIVERLIIAVGAALSQATRAIENLEEFLPELSEMIELRNQVVHEYWDMDADRVWSLVAAKGPAFSSLLRTLLAEQALPLPERRVQGG